MLLTAGLPERVRSLVTGPSEAGAWINVRYPSLSAKNSKNGYNTLMAEPSIFTKIINGEIPCHKVYEDEKTFAFLDIYPVQPGQVLVVPKNQVGFVWDLEQDEYQALMATVQKVGQRLREMYPEASRVGVMIEGLDVADHAHIKVFPFSTAEEYRNVPDTNKEPDHAALAELAKRLAF